MPVTTSVRCHCKKVLEHDDAIWKEGMPYCPDCVPKTLDGPVDTSDEATGPERRAVLQEAPEPVLHEGVLVKRDTTQVAVPQSVDDDDPERGCGPVVIEEMGPGERALDYQVITDIRRAIDDAGGGVRYAANQGWPIHGEGAQALEADLTLAEQDAELLTERLYSARQAVVNLKTTIEGLSAPVEQESLDLLKRLLTSALRRF